MYTWDSNKSRLNKEKHGISFEEAKDSIFEGSNILASGIAHDVKEEGRHAIIGKHQGHYYVGVFTFVNSQIRIISVRRAREKEKNLAKNRGL